MNSYVNVERKDSVINTCTTFNGFEWMKHFSFSLTQQEQDDLLLAQAIAASQEENRREQRRRVGFIVT